MPMKKGTHFDRNPFADEDRMRMTGDRIAKLRNKKDLTQDGLMNLLEEELPEDKRCNTSSVKNFERGTSDPTASWLLKLSEKLECDVDYLLGAHGQNVPRKASADMPSVTGLDNRSCCKLEIPQDRVYLGPIETFSWFIDHGLQEIIYTAEEEIDNLHASASASKKLPEKIRVLFEDISLHIVPNSDPVVLRDRFFTKLTGMPNDELNSIVQCCENDPSSHYEEGEAEVFDKLIDRPLYSMIKKNRKKTDMVRKAYAYTASAFLSYISLREREANLIIRFQYNMQELLSQYMNETATYRKERRDNNGKY